MKKAIRTSGRLSLGVITISVITKRERTHTSISEYIELSKRQDMQHTLVIELMPTMSKHRRACQYERRNPFEQTESERKKSVDQLESHVRPLLQRSKAIVLCSAQTNNIDLNRPRRKKRN